MSTTSTLPPLNSHSTLERDAERAISESWAFRSGRAQGQMTLPVLQQVVRTIEQRLQGTFKPHWCVIGGCAVMLHLLDSRQSAAMAYSRASPDIDILSSHQPMSRMRKTENLMIGGMTYELDLDDGATHEIDWITGKHCPSLHKLYQHALQCSTVVRDVRVIDPAHLVASKLAIGTRAWRPKDHTDVHLLMRYGGVSRMEIAEILNSCLEPPLRSEANDRFRKLAA